MYPSCCPTTTRLAFRKHQEEGNIKRWKQQCIVLVLPWLKSTPTANGFAVTSSTRSSSTSQVCIISHIFYVYSIVSLFLRELNSPVPNTSYICHCDFNAAIYCNAHAATAGFTKNQLKVQVEPSASLRISGERALHGGRQWCHFLKRFDLPAACDAGAIKVKLDKGVLYVQLPRPSAATTDDDSEDYPEDALPEEEHAGAYWTSGHTAAWRDDAHPARRLAKGLGKHRHVVLNVVLAVVLLWLVAFATSRPSGGQVRND